MKKLIILLFVFTYNNAFCNEYSYKIGNDVVLITIDESYKYMLDLLMNNYKDLSNDRDLSIDTFTLDIQISLDNYLSYSYYTTGNAKYYMDPVTMTKFEGGSHGYVRYRNQEFSIPSIVSFNIIGKKNNVDIFNQQISWRIGMPDIITNEYQFKYIHKMLLLKLFYFFEYYVAIDVTNYQSDITLCNTTRNSYQRASLEKKEKIKNQKYDYHHHKIEYWYLQDRAKN